MRLYLIRHGQSTNNAIAHLPTQEIRLKRSHDPLLTETGQQQAQHLADFLATMVDTTAPLLDPLALTHLYVSPMIRALDTAKPTAEKLAIQPQIWKDICEIGGLFNVDENDNITSFPGLTRTDIEEQYPTYIISDDITETGWWDINHGMETPDQFYGRALRVAGTLRKRATTDEQIALVAHAAFLDALMKTFLQQIPTHPNRLFYNHYNTGITRIDFADSKYTDSIDHMRIHYLNRVDHLPSALRTD